MWRQPFFTFLPFYLFTFKLNSSSQLVDDTCLPCHEVASFDVVACVGDETEVEREVVDAGNLHCEQLLRLKQVVEVSLRIDAVDIATVGVDG